MEMPRSNKSGRGRFEGLKSRLGFSSPAQQDDYGDEYGDGYADDYREYASYEDPAGAGAPYAGGQAVSSPHLISYDEVRASTQLPESLNRNPLPERKVSSAQPGAYVPASGYRSGSASFPRKIERASDYMISTDTSDLPLRPDTSRSPGYDSLFMPQGQTQTAPGRPQPKAFDPYDAYQGAGMATHSPTRALRILKPSSYSDAEQVAKIIRAGDVVVLSMRNTPDQLAKRILDFSFGAASALDATVDCIAEKVFVVIRGHALSAEEYNMLNSQGAFS